MRDKQWTRDRVSIAEHAQITAQHESGHELSTARASAACSMAWPSSTKTRSPRSSIAEDALIMAQLSGSTCDSHPRPASIEDMQHGRTKTLRILQTEPLKVYMETDRERRPASSQRTSDQATTSTTDDSVEDDDIDQDDHRTGYWLWTVPEQWFGTVKKCK